MLIQIMTKTPKRTALSDQKQLEREGVNSTVKRFKDGYILTTVSDRIVYTK